MKRAYLRTLVIFGVAYATVMLVLALAEADGILIFLVSTILAFPLSVAVPEVCNLLSIDGSSGLAYIAFNGAAGLAFWLAVTWLKTRERGYRSRA
ncbi:MULTISPECIES: hypothetical protein [Sphingomonas]|uniref:hypothetical protein n=1 Tax=Sphingomonas TaxID=13687 RepID=UPI000DEEFE7D|nr:MULTISPECIES: hypothetical protein [Sphingomonas]